MIKSQDSCLFTKYIIGFSQIETTNLILKLDRQSKSYRLLQLCKNNKKKEWTTKQKQEKKLGTRVGEPTRENLMKYKNLDVLRDVSVPSSSQIRWTRVMCYLATVAVSFCPSVRFLVVLLCIEIRLRLLRNIMFYCYKNQIIFRKIQCYKLKRVSIWLAGKSVQ